MFDSKPLKKQNQKILANIQTETSPQQISQTRWQFILSNLKYDLDDIDFGVARSNVFNNKDANAFIDITAKTIELADDVFDRLLSVPTLMNYFDVAEDKEECPDY